MAVEFTIFAIGIILYRKISQTNTINFWALIGVLLIFWLANFFGPPPPSEVAIAVAGNAMWLFVFWAYRTDRVSK